MNLSALLSRIYTKGFLINIVRIKLSEDLGIGKIKEWLTKRRNK